MEDRIVIDGIPMDTEVDTEVDAEEDEEVVVEDYNSQLEPL